MKSTIAAIDFGTCKIVTLVAETSGTQRCDIIGAGIAAYDGFLDGEWNNTVMLNEAIQKSITEAETQSKRKIREINVGVPGEFTRVYAVETSVTIQGADPHVTPRHVEKIFANADKQLSPVRGVVVHRSPAWFTVDDRRTMEPAGLKGSVVKCMASFVIADATFLEDMQARMEEQDIHINGYLSPALGEALLLIPPEERDKVAVLVDVGYLSTEVMFVQGDALIRHEVLPMGGGHLAADLAMELSITMDMAEELKRTVSLRPDFAPDEMISFTHSSREFDISKADLYDIVKCRLEELADELVKPQIKASRVALLPGGMLLTGGVSKTEGIDEFMLDVMDLPARIAMPVDANRMPPGRNTQEYSSAAGIIKYILTRERDPFRYLDNPAIGGGKAEAPKVQVYAPPVGDNPQSGSKEKKEGGFNPLKSIGDMFKDLF